MIKQFIYLHIFLLVEVTEPDVLVWFCSPCNRHRTKHNGHHSLLTTNKGYFHYLLLFIITLLREAELLQEFLNITVTDNCLNKCLQKSRAFRRLKSPNSTHQDLSGYLRAKLSVRGSAYLSVSRLGFVLPA